LQQQEQRSSSKGSSLNPVPAAEAGKEVARKKRYPWGDGNVAPAEPAADVEAKKQRSKQETIGVAAPGS
jgi:hypothetical protein